MKNVNPAKMAALNTRFFALQEKMLKENNFSFFKAFEAFLDKHAGAVSTAETVRSFRIGDVFRHRDSSCVPQYHDDQFVTWYTKPSVDKVIPIDFAHMPHLKEYVLPEDMKDSGIQEAAQSRIMTETEWSLTLYALIIEPELGKAHLSYKLRKDKRYIFHVQLDDESLVVFRVHWDDGGWYCDAYCFGLGAEWREGRVFLHLTSGIIEIP